MNGTDSPFQFNLKTTRLGRTSYGISGTVLVKDALKDYEVWGIAFLHKFCLILLNILLPQVEAKLYFDASGNGDYVLHPLKKPRTTVCNVLNDEYRKYVMESYSKTSDFPNSDDKDICPLFEKVTWSRSKVTLEFGNKSQHPRPLGPRT